MAKDQWTVVYKGIRVKEHPTRKHGIKPDIYYSCRFQFNGKRVNSGLGWSSEGWTQAKAIAELERLKNEAREGTGVETYRQKQVQADEEKKEQDRIEQVQQEQEAKDNMPLSTYFDEIYFPAISQEKKHKTAITEEQLFRLWVKPAMGHKPLKDIVKLDLERLKKTMLDAGKAPRSVEYALITLGQIFRHAEAGKYFKGDIPKLDKKTIKYDNKRVKFLTRDEAHALLANIRKKSQETYEMALLSLHCGSRAGEIFSLRWKDIDLEHGLITLLNTKSGKTRTVPMTGDIKAIFAAKEQNDKGDLIFPDRKTGGVRTQISKTFTRAVVETGLNTGIDDRRQRVTFHSMRHTYASWLVQEGVNIYQVKELLGHESITTTERYAHLAPEFAKAAEILGKLFNADTGESNIVNLK